MKRGRRENGSVRPARKPRVLKSRVHELHFTTVLQVPLGEREEALAGLERSHVKAPREETAGQLTGTASDLEYPVTAFEPRVLAGTIDELVRIRGTATVILGSHVVKDTPIPACGSSFRHACNVEDGPDGISSEQDAVRPSRSHATARRHSRLPAPAPRI